MKNYLYFFLLFLNLHISTAQDAYHQQWIETFKTTYQIPIGEWVFFDNEEEIVGAATNYGGSYSAANSENTDFSQIVKVSITRAGANAWDSGWSLKNQKPINTNDKVLMMLSIRPIGEAGRVNIFAEHTTTFNKEVFSFMK